MVHAWNGVLVVQRNEVLTHTKTWMNCKTFFEVKGASHRRSHILQFNLYEMFKIGKSTESESS